MVTEELLVRKHRFSGESASRRQVEAADAFVVERHDTFAGPKLRDDLGVIARQRALPVERVDAVGEARGPEFFETPDLADAQLAGRAHFSAKRTANSLASAL